MTATATTKNAPAPLQRLEGDDPTTKGKIMTIVSPTTPSSNLPIATPQLVRHAATGLENQYVAETRRLDERAAEIRARRAIAFDELCTNLAWMDIPVIPIDYYDPDTATVGSIVHVAHQHEDRIHDDLRTRDHFFIDDHGVWRVKKLGVPIKARGYRNGKGFVHTYVGQWKIIEVDYATHTAYAIPAGEVEA